MKKVYDPTVSKKPFMVPDDTDSARLTTLIEKQKQDIAALDRRLSLLKSTPEYLRVVLASKQRMIDIACAVMELPPDDVKAISRAQGSYFERKRLTDEFANLETDKRDKVSFVNKLVEQLHVLSDKIKKFKEGRK